MQKKAGELLEWVFARKIQLAIVVVLLFVAAAASAFALPVNFMPTSPSNQVTVEVELPESASQQELDAEVARLESKLKVNPNIESYTSMQGSSFIPKTDDVFDDSGGWVQDPHSANVWITLKPKVDPAAFSSKLREEIKQFSQLGFYTVSNQNLSGDDNQLKIYLTGADNQTLANAANLIKSKLTLIPGVAVGGATNLSEPLTTYQITLNQDAIRSHGLTEQEVISRISLYLSHGAQLSLQLDHHPIPVVVHLDSVEQLGNNAEQELFKSIANETLIGKDNHQVPISQLATLSTSQLPSLIQERNGTPYAVVTANLLTNDVEAAAHQVQQVMNTLSLPAGVHYSYAGASTQVDQMLVQMGFALTASVVLVLLILSLLFKGWKAPVAVLLCIPLASIGSIFGLLLFGRSWNLASLVGLLMLTGIVVTNGIVLVDKIERNLADGMEMDEAVARGTESRVRPVCMTALTTILTLLPLAFSPSDSSIFSQTLAIVVIGGMISSTGISLLVIPVFYRWLQKNRPLTAENPNRAVAS